MKIFFSAIYLLFLTAPAYSQLHIGIFGGTSVYRGDLASKPFGRKQTKAVFGFTLNHEISEHLMLRAGMSFAKVAGADSLDKNDWLKLRNLSFQSNITEFSLLGEYYLFDLNENNYSPYFFAGIAVYHFDPYAYDQNGNKIFLQPLSTEGQGLSGYPIQKPYSLTQMAIPFGGGFKLAINDNWQVGIEFGMRKLFTDFLDDVSTNYADMNDLLNAKGPLAVQMAYRGDEVTNGDPTYPSKGYQRGNVKTKDWYYFIGLHLTFKISNSGSGGYSGNRKSGCPASF